MKKASRIILLIGAITGFVAAISLLICGIIFLVLGSPTMVQIIKEGIQNGTLETTESLDVAIAIWQATFISLGTFFLLFQLVMLAASIVGLIARKRESKPLYVVAIVLGAIGNEIILAGAILGRIAVRHKGEEKVADVQ